MKYFFAGIKGSGMAGLACMLKNLGNDVIGCDDTKVYTFTEDALYENDIKVYKDAYFLTSDMIFIYTAAIHEDHYAYKKAKELNADYIATGHYARLIDGKLAKAVDTNKDQSYFLAYVNRDVFRDVLFPLGEITKPEVRKIAHEYGLITAEKKDSTGICFIGERNFTKFLENYLPNIPGDIVNIDTGEILGKHIGLMYYTIGQRRGLNIGGTKDRCFVVKKDLDKNILYVAIGDENKYLYSTSCIIEDFNFLTDERPNKCKCKFRYRQPDVNTKVEYLDNNMLKLDYVRTKAVTEGQVCVLYDGDICLGGGIIKEVKENN